MILTATDRLTAFSGTQEAEHYDRLARALSAASIIEPVSKLRYGSEDRQQIEFYCPADTAPGKNLPVLVFFHGGAWIAGGFEWLRFMAEAVTSQPAILVAVSYRLAPAHKWPAQYEDAVAAVRLVQSEAARHGGDPGRIVVSGHSAGGQMAAMAVLAGDIGPVRGCMPISSPMDLRYGRIASDTGKGRVYRYLLQQPTNDEDASPIRYIEGNTTPFHFTWGEDDFEHVRDSCARMVAAMAEASQPVDHEVRRAAGHFDTHLKLHDAQDGWYRAFGRLAA